MASLVWAAMVAGFTLVLGVNLGRWQWRVRRAAQRLADSTAAGRDTKAGATAGAAWPPILLLRPVEAPRPEEMENLRAPLDYPGNLTVVALAPVPLALGPQVRCVLSNPSCANRKVGHILAGLRAFAPHLVPQSGLAPPPVSRGAGPALQVVVADADVRVTAALLQDLCAVAASRQASLVQAAPAPGLAPSLVAWAVTALFTNTAQSFLALEVMSWGAKSVCGKAVWLGPAACALLTEVKDAAGEDLALAAHLRRGRGRVALATRAAQVVQSPVLSWGEALGRFSRWMQVLRAHRPRLYPWVPLVIAPVWPLLGVAALCQERWLWWACGVVVGLRSLVSLLLEHLYADVLQAGRDRARWWALVRWPLGEALLIAAFVGSCCRRHLTWRGRRYRLQANGRLRPEPFAPPEQV